VRFSVRARRLATRPLATGSSPLVKTIGVVEVAPFGVCRKVAAACGDQGDPTVDELGGQRW
jgi:hypothetical protein